MRIYITPAPWCLCFAMWCDSIFDLGLFCLQENQYSCLQEPTENDLTHCTSLLNTGRNGALNVSTSPLFHHYNDVIMTTMASQITSLTVVYSTVYSNADQIKHQSSASLAFVWGSHRDRWIPRTNGQLRGIFFHLMTSSWNTELERDKVFWFHTGTDLGQVTHICVNKPVLYLYKWWLIACFTPSHHLNQYWLTINWALWN